MILTHTAALFEDMFTKLESGLNEIKVEIEKKKYEDDDGDESHLLVPVCQRHHDVQGSKGKHHVEEGPRVGHLILFIVPHLVGFGIGVAALSVVLDQQLVGSAELGGLGVGCSSD